MELNTNTSKIHVLYIGSDMQFITVLTRCLSWMNFHIEPHGFNAQKYLANNPLCDIIMSDQNIPGVKGLHFFLYLRENGIYSNAAFILCSSKLDYEVRIQAIKQGIDEYLLYDIDAETLKVRLEYLMSYRKRHSRNRLPRYAREKDSENFDSETTGFRSLPVGQLAVKRAFDVVASGMGLLLLSPLFLIVAAAIRLESKGPVFYASKRVGQKTFDFYKFRSMYTGSDARLKELEHLNQYAAEQGKKGIDFTIECNCKSEGRITDNYCSELLVFSDGKSMCEQMFLQQKKEIAGPTFFKLKNDPRITKVGAFIRRTSIDELPQLVNVLKGDMSIVGNRPLPINEAEALTKGEAVKRFLAPAGITGLWQVELRGKKGQMSEEERRNLDNDYYDNFSLWFDAKIILRTIPALFQEENA
jgi:lipopolysaccharide/colanic/teichoic acid biosynthesis glycosyltransferase